MYFLPLMCQQCEHPPCVGVCPTGAAAKSPEDGVVYIDTSRCTGCQSCKRACPYEATILNNEMHVMDKCTLCPELRQRGEKPPCVVNCSGGALFFGDLRDPESDVCRRIAREKPEHVHSLTDFGNKPAGRFILRRAHWIPTLPHRFREAEEVGQ
jgi:Fe-S-cluster-containing dehydrogenase component